MTRAAQSARRSIVRVRQAARRRIALGALVGVLLASVVLCTTLDLDAPVAALAAAVADAPMAAAGSPVVAAMAEAPAAPERHLDAAAGEPAPPLPDLVVDDPRIAGWVADLHDDDVRWNALVAWRELVRLPPGRIDALEAALRSWDGQQRAFAAIVLRERCEAGRATPSEALFAASTETLRSDVRVGVEGTSAQPLRGTSLRFLVSHAEAAAPALRSALGADDLQQRVYAAFALAPVARADDVPRIVQQLVPRLEDNAVMGDALMACHALYRLGAAGLPALRAWRGHVDGQARSLIDLIEADLVAPPPDVATLRERGRRARVSSVYHDAAIEFDLSRSALPRL